MANEHKTDIWVYAHWKGMEHPRNMGLLSASQSKGRTLFNFKYDSNWFNSADRFLLDPDINWYSGPQFPNNKENFGVFTDSMPDTWGRKLLQRRASQIAKEEKKPLRSLQDLDYLLGVHDFTRMGALRFKADIDGPFLDSDNKMPVPPWASIRELQHSAKVFEQDTKGEDKHALEVLLAPGSSLGGARPKANITDELGNLWIAKFPAKNDITDKAAWEYLAHRLAQQCGITMSECKLEHIHGDYRTFFTKRFDRDGNDRIHFSSAMTMTGNNEELIRDHTASYLEIAEFLQNSGSQNKADLQELWRRIVYNIAISNTDDHLRNHGFLLTDSGWTLSPAYDLNPSVDKSGLGLNIDLYNNALDIDLAKSVGEYFQLNNREMDQITSEITEGISNWREIANDLSIPRHEQELMAGAFRLKNSRNNTHGYGR
ncbi:MAG: type II toxin-antitoxin system HipA family toxin [Sphingobacteriales bacterium]